MRPHPGGDRDVAQPAGPRHGAAPPWRGTIGAIVGAGAVDFRVWAPVARGMDLVVERDGHADEIRRMTGAPDGTFSLTWNGLGRGTLYRYRIDGHAPLPDPASRYQPRGVHGPSCVVDPGFAWTDHDWSGVAAEALVIYELHVGTFSPAGTFAGVTARLPDLQRLGVTAVELMPVADFPGRRNWGYDGVAPFAPARCYGTPDELRQLVDTAHRLGLAVLLDVVYNHLGPDGAYLSSFSPYYFTDRHASPWGAGIDLDGANSQPVRAYLIENALHWIHEYHVDGLRLDATHALHDDSPTHLVAELAAAVHGSVRGRHVHVIAEDDRNLAAMVMAPAESGWGLDAVWADDFHHQMRRLLAGDDDGYYRDYGGSTADIAATLRQGWFYTGQPSGYRGGPRGSDPAAVPPRRFVICLQNHDQIGNRARGERLHHQITPEAFGAATVLLLTAPQTPLLFMGQEWAATSPFQYFTDHAEPLGRLVTEGRRREFGAFAAFAGGDSSVPDPQAETTFTDSQLVWPERDSEPHAAVLRLHRAVLEFRRAELAPEAAQMVTAVALDADTVGLRRTTRGGGMALVVARLRGSGDVDLDGAGLAPKGLRWTCRLTSRERGDGALTMGPEIDGLPTTPRIRFHGPAAVILVSVPPPADGLGRVAGPAS